MTPDGRLDAMIDGFRVMDRISHDGAVTALAQALARQDAEELAAFLALAVQRLATQGGRR